EVPGPDRPVDRGDDLGERDLRRLAGEHVAAADPALGPHEPRALQREEDLLEVGLGEARALRDVPHRGGAVVAVQRQRQQRPARVVTSCRDLHGRHRRRGGPMTRRRPSGAKMVGRPGGRHIGADPEPDVASVGGVLSEEIPAVGDRGVGVATRPADQRVDDQPVLPNYDGACVSNVMDVLIEDPDDPPQWFPAGVAGARQIVLLVLDGLGWEQMQQRSHLLRGLTSLEAAPITTVAPTTTATALTSIATGLPPGEHGVIGYRMSVDDDILNVLRWSTSRGDARELIPPESIQHDVAFGGQRPPVVVRAEFRDSGFSRAHLGGCRHVPYRMPSTLVAEIRNQLALGEPFVYAYYDGVDKVAHEYGLGE